MTKKKRDRVDGSKGLQQIVADAALPIIEPPATANLNDAEKAIWCVFVNAKARRAWKDQDLNTLVNLCRVHTKIEDLEKAQRLLDPVDDLLVYEKIERMIDLSVKRYRLLCVYLQIHPEATQGKSREQVKQNKTHSEAVGNSAPDDDGLIPRPNTH